MSNCLNCGAEIEQVKGRRKRVFCDNKNKCKGEYNRKQNKAPKYVQYKSFQELQKKFDEMAAAKEEWFNACVAVTDEFTKFKMILQAKEKQADFEKIKDKAEYLHKNGADIETTKAIATENKPIAAPKKESVAKDTTTRKRNEPGALDEANNEAGERLEEKKVDVAEIERQISAIKAEKIPKERDTPLGRQPWRNDQQKKIANLRKLISA